MGCDTHMYVEYKDKKRENNYWKSFGGRINPGRNYWMFGLMSKGVRCEFDESFEPKGMPENSGYHSNNDNKLYITDSTDESGCCTLDQALSWAKHGCKIEYYDNKPTWVSHPDWHSHTWLSINEYEKVIEAYNKRSNESEPEYEALLSAMKKLQDFDNEVRIVVWFDN